jgi:hypothetical protein
MEIGLILIVLTVFYYVSISEAIKIPREDYHSTLGLKVVLMALFMMVLGGSMVAVYDIAYNTATENSKREVFKTFYDAGCYEVLTNRETSKTKAVVTYPCEVSTPIMIGSESP